MQDGGGNILRNRGCSRLMIALVIAVVGIIAYMSRTEVNPVTGEKQHVALSVDQEKVLGLEAAPEMASKMGGEVDPSDPESAHGPGGRPARRREEQRRLEPLRRELPVSSSGGSRDHQCLRPARRADLHHARSLRQAAGRGGARRGARPRGRPRHPSPFRRADGEGPARRRSFLRPSASRRPTAPTAGSTPRWSPPW